MLSHEAWCNPNVSEVSATSWCCARAPWASKAGTKLSRPQVIIFSLQKIQTVCVCGLRVKCEMLSVKSQMLSVRCPILSVECQMLNVTRQCLGLCRPWVVGEIGNIQWLALIESSSHIAGQSCHGQRNHIRYPFGSV